MRLHTLTAGRTSPEEAEMRVNLVAGMLSQRFTDDVFTERSLEHVASRCRFWPAYGELVEGLRDFARIFIHQPVAALPAPRQEGRPPPDEAERHHVRAAIEGLMTDLAAARVEREAHDPGLVLRPLADVTAKGEHLAAVRASGRKMAA